MGQKCLQIFVGYTKKRDHLEGLSMGGSITLNLTLKKQNGRGCTTFLWIMMWTNGGIWKQKLNLGNKLLVISWQTEKSAASWSRLRKIRSLLSSSSNPQQSIKNTLYTLNNSTHNLQVCMYVCMYVYETHVTFRGCGRYVCVRSRVQKFPA